MKRITYLMLVGVALVAAATLGGTHPAHANTGPAGATFYANSPSGVDPLGSDSGIPLRKFVDSLPGLGPANANNLGQYIPIAVADTLTYPGSDYYHLEALEFTEKVHSDLPKATKFRGYRDVGGNQPAHYLGPLIIAKKDRPVRVLFDNKLGISTDLAGDKGNLFIPVDTVMMGAGQGPPVPDPGGTVANYTQNRISVHLHGGFPPWISDGTPHQWFTPAGETTIYPKGASFQNVPDINVAPAGMPIPPDGSQTLYWTNQQSNRLMFYHDHALGITRLNVYAGMAAGYLVTDPVEDDLINGTNLTGANPPPPGQSASLKLLPNQGAGVYNYGIPLVIQDKTFVPKNIAVQDAKWVDPAWADPAWGIYGDLWFPHVYEPNQDPTVNSGASQYGRWDYGPWFWPVFPAQLLPGMVPNPDLKLVHPQDYGRSSVPEAFMDTMMVNGTAYPYVEVPPTAVRFRILNACNDRYLNLSLFKAMNQTEVKMVPAIYKKNYPPTWPVDNRVGGVPDPKKAGPDIIQIGTEAGFLPAPVVIPAQPVNYVYNRRDVVVLNVSDKALYLGPAERADVIIDFSKFKGKSLILYNDAPAPMPGFDPRNDYYTGNPDMTDTGGAPSTVKGFGPNTRTIMLIKVKGKKTKPFDLAALQAAWPLVYVNDQPPPIVPQTAYPLQYKAATDTYARIQDNNVTFTPVGSVTPTTVALQPKTIQELFDDYGRMNSTLGTELPFTTAFIQTTIPLKYIDPPTEVLNPGVPQLWKITHNGVDTHAVHFHLVNVQLINRVGWDGAIRPPDANELGLKETIRMNPLEDIIVALKGDYPTGIPFAVPDSVRLLDPTKAQGTSAQFSNIDPTTGQPTTVTNEMTNFGWEYVWHCHLLGHEENDMMRPIVLAPAP
jgi:FtsP/CotA-like multicopper oxidase with cupredoxin domain